MTIIGASVSIKSNNSKGEIAMRESKRERFIRLAEARTNKTMDMLRLLGNCANKSNYDYDEEDIKQIFAAIEKEVKAAKNAFMGLESKEERFALKR